MIDNPCDHMEEIRELKRVVRELATHSGLGHSSISSGALKILTPDETPGGGGAIEAGGVKISANNGGEVTAGGAKISASDGGKVEAGGTKIGADGKISNSSNKLIVSSNTEFAGNVEAAGTSKATVVEGTGAVKSGGYVEAGGTQIRANGSLWNASNDLKVSSNTDFAGNATAAGTMKASVVEATGTLYSPWRGGKQSVESLAEDIQANALQGINDASAAHSRANSAWNLANGKASQAQVNNLESALEAAADNDVAIAAAITRIRNVYNAHIDAEHPGLPKMTS